MTFTCAQAGCEEEATHLVMQMQPLTLLFASGAGYTCEKHAQCRTWAAKCSCSAKPFVSLRGCGCRELRPVDGDHGPGPSASLSLRVPRDVAGGGGVIFAKLVRGRRFEHKEAAEHLRAAASFWIPNPRDDMEIRQLVNEWTESGRRAAERRGR